MIKYRSTQRSQKYFWWNFHNLVFSQNWLTIIYQLNHRHTVPILKLKLSQNSDYFKVN